jgi:plasmid maintenance system antidote protein VapI
VTDDRDWTVPPGATLDEWREEQGIDVATLAQRLDLYPDQYHALVSGGYMITLEFAERLFAVTGISVEFWVEYERTFREDLAKGRRP